MEYVCFACGITPVLKPGWMCKYCQRDAQNHSNINYRMVSFAHSFTWNIRGE